MLVNSWQCFSHFWVLYLAGVPQTKPCIDLHQLFRMCLATNDLDLIKCLRVSCKNCCHVNNYILGGLKPCGCSQTPNPGRDLYQIFRMGFSLNPLNLISCWKYLATTVAVATLFIFGGLKIFISLQLISMHEFSPNLKHRFTLR